MTMKRIYHHYYFIATLLAALAACSDDVQLTPEMSREQRQLLGRAVNFNTSIAEAFESRASYNHDGQFNQGDWMKIFRQYSHDGGLTFDPATTSYRIYYYIPKYAGGTQIVLPNGWQWHVLPGKTGSNNGVLFTQTAADSLSWENGNSVRFFASALSNLSGALDANSWSRYYPDYMLSNTVSSSGPSESVPLTMRHLGCRIGFAPRNSGNQIAKVEICLDAEDYVRNDNAGSAADDEADKLQAAEASAEYVRSVYNRMCAPGGIDLENSRLNALVRSYVDGGGKVQELYLDATQAQMVTLGTKTMAEIASEVVRPYFVPNDNRYYMISIPHDMSSDFAQAGQLITLPPYTRFKVWLRDVNSGDTQAGDKLESTYHIFSLSDIKDADGNQVFNDTNLGLTLHAGRSYLFYVGYHYDTFTVESDPSFLWTEHDIAAGDFSDTTTPTPDASEYDWWNDAIELAIYNSVNLNAQYKPEFTISTKEEFISFMKLVNGTADQHTGTLKRAFRKGKTNPDNELHYWWYDPDNLRDANGDTIWVTHEQARERGFVFYKRFIPADGDKASYVTEDYLTGSYNFYSDIVKRHFNVNLACDVDFDDCMIPPIGSAATPFLGNFNGGMHTVSNVAVEGNYLFGEVQGGSITNLRLRSSYALGLLNKGVESHIAGIDIEAPSPTPAAIVASLTGTDAKSPAYVVGCTHRSRSPADAAVPLIGTGDHLRVWGCMNTVGGISGGAILGSYADPSNMFLAPQVLEEDEPVAGGNMMCCYYDTEQSAAANAVDDIADTYRYKEYVRGCRTHVLCARVDNLIAEDVLDKLTDPNQKADFYGIAPWRAMNCAIDRYNTTAVGRLQPCKAHYEVNSTGYDMRYPVLLDGIPTTEQIGNILK